MKKTFAWILASVMLLTCAFALAEEVVPSKTTEDLIIVNTATDASGQEVEELIVVVTNDEEHKAVIDAIVEKAAASQAPAVEIFQPAAQEAIAAALPEEVKAEELILAELIHIDAPAYVPDNGAVKANFTFPVVYKPAQKIIAVVLIHTGVIDPVTGEEILEEVVLEAYANEDGTVTVDFTQEAMTLIASDKNATLAILCTEGKAEEAAE